MARDARSVMLHKYPCSKKQAFSDQKITNSMPRLTQAQRDQAIAMSTMGASHRQIARTFNCSQTTIRRLLIHYQQTGQTQDRSGRPKITTAAGNWYIRQIHLRNRFVTATATAATAPAMSSAAEQHCDVYVKLVYEPTAPSVEWP